MSPSASPLNHAHGPKPSPPDLAALGQKLIQAAKDGRLDEVRDALDLGAPVNARDNRDWTALMWAAWKGHESVGTLLLVRGADRLLKNNDGKTALDLAKNRGHTGMVKLLRSRGAAVELSDEFADMPANVWFWLIALYWGFIVLLGFIGAVAAALLYHPFFCLFAALLLLAFLVILRKWDKG